MLAMVFDFGTMFATNIIIMTINSYGGIMNDNNELDEFAIFFCTALPFCVVWSGGFIFLSSNNSPVWPICWGTIMELLLVMMMVMMTMIMTVFFLCSFAKELSKEERSLLTYITTHYIAKRL